MGWFKKVRCPTEAELVTAKQEAAVAKAEYRSASSAYHLCDDLKDSAESIVRMQITQLEKRKVSDTS